MAVTDMMTQPITLHYETPVIVDDLPVVDSDGQPQVTVSNVATVCYSQQTGSSIDEGGKLVVTAVRVFVPRDTVIDGLASVTLDDGRDFAVSSTPHAQWAPRLQRVEYVTFNVTRGVS